MKDIRIDFTQSEPCLDSKQLGEYGEKGVERFAITPPVEMSENPEIRFYVVAFSTARGPVRLNPIEKTEVIYVPVEEACIGGVPLALQLEGHNDTSTLIFKTPVIEGFSFAKSVPEGSIRFLGGIQNAGHLHSNLEVLHKLGEENGNLVFNGREIGSKAYKTVELSARNGDSITYCDYSYSGSVFFFAKSIPIGAESLQPQEGLNEILHALDLDKTFLGMGCIVQFRVESQRGQWCFQLMGNICGQLACAVTLLGIELSCPCKR